MLHDNLILHLALAVGNEDRALLLVSFIELLLKEDSSLVVLLVSALADLLLVVKDVQQVARNSGPEDQL